MSEYRFRIDRAEIENRRDNLRFEPDSGMAPEELIRGCERIAASDKPRALIKASCSAISSRTPGSSCRARRCSPTASTTTA